MDLAAYSQKKRQLTLDLQKLRTVSKELALSNLMHDLTKYLSSLSDEHFELVVVGEFSRGKSTFVNAMLGRRILPSSKKPTTAIISKIVYEDTPTYTLFYKDGSRKGLTEEDFLKITAPREGSLMDKIRSFASKKDQDELDKISYAEVGYPLSFCRENVEVVDTPGTNDLNVGRIEITYGYINKADAIIMLLSATQAMSQSESDFLRERILGNQIRDIFFVISYKDQLHSKDEEQRVIKFVSDAIYKIAPELGDSLHIHLLSSKQALVYRRLENGEVLKPNVVAQKPDTLEETGLPEFEDALGTFLSEEKGRIKLAKYINYGVQTAGKIQKDIDVRLEMAKHSADDIRQQAAKLEPKFLHAKQEVERAVVRMRRNLQQLHGDIESACNESKNDMYNIIARTVERYHGEINEKELNTSLGREMTQNQKKLIDCLQSVQKNCFDTEQRKMRDTLSRIWKDVDLGYQSGFNLPAKIVQENISIHVDVPSGENGSDTFGNISLGIAALGLIVGAAPLGVLFYGALGFLSKSGIFGKREDPSEKVTRELRKQCDKNYEMIQGKLVDSYEKQVKSFLDSIEASANGRVEDMRAQLNSVIAMKQSQEADAKQQLEKLRQQQEYVGGVCRHMQTILTR